MRWSFRIGRIAGIDVYVHATFALLLIWVAYISYSPHNEMKDVLAGLVFILCLFAIIVLHELGHAITARQYGIKTRDITLLPIGGVARLERMPTDPKQELLVALAGPAVNFVLAGLLFLVLILTGWAIGNAEQWTSALRTFGGNLLVQLFAANIFLAVFNLIPAFPMDGGRVFRAILAMRFDYIKATRIAAEVGQFIAILFGIVGLMSGGNHPFLIVIAVFVWVGAAAEAAAVQFKVGLAGVPVSRAMIREFATLSPDDTLVSAARKTLDGFQDDFPVVSGEKVIGVLPRSELLAGLAEAWPDGQVKHFVRTDFGTAEPDEMVELVFDRLNAGACPVLPVIERGHLVGLLTARNVAELVMIRQAVSKRKPIPSEQSERTERTQASGRS